MKYMTNIGQNTGILKQSKNVHIKAITVLFVTEYQNLNSGNLLINGLNSSFALIGSSGPFSSAKTFKVHLDIRTCLQYISTNLPSKSMAGSIFGVKNAINRFK